MRSRRRLCALSSHNRLSFSIVCLLITSFFLNFFFLSHHDERHRVTNERDETYDRFFPHKKSTDYNTINNRTDDLLQFAIIGFGKCGTTSVLKWLQSHSEIAVMPVENYDLMRHQPEQLIRKLEGLPAYKLKGYKSPVDVTLPHVLQYFADYFPRAKLIVGVRHPVQWFESLYNFRLQQRSHFSTTPMRLPPPDELIGACVASARNTCTYKGEFALFLRQLGKTKYPSIVTEFERRMYRGAHLEPPNTTSTVISQQSTMVIANPIFIYEMRQLQDHPELMAQALTEFLGLSTPLSFDIPYHNQQKRSLDTTVLTETNRTRMNICDHRRVRFELMRIARSSSVWIRNYFLTAPESSQIVSLPQFASYVKDWMVDPCTDRQEETQSAGRYILQAFRDEQEQAKQH